MPGVLWSFAEDERIRAEYPATKTDALAASMGRTTRAVRRRANDLGVAKDAAFMSRHKSMIARSLTSDVSLSGRFKPVHGQSEDKRAGVTYNAWQSMIARCTNPKHKSYAVYGGSGISVCDEWRRSFVAFLRDMGPRPNGTTIDRFPDGAGSYGPGNCRWATPKEQAKNRKTTEWLTAFGQTMTIYEFGAKYGIASDTLRWRLRHMKLTPEEALTRPVAKSTRSRNLVSAT